MLIAPKIAVDFSNVCLIKKRFKGCPSFIAIGFSLRVPLLGDTALGFFF